MPHRLGVGLLTAALLWSSVVAQQGAPPGQWPTYGGDHASTKYSPLDQIDRATVERLQVVWRWASPDNEVVTANRTTLPSLPAAFKATPILADGVLYIKTSLSQAAAIDAATGETLWVFDPGTWEGERPANMGYNARGVAYWSDGREAPHFLADRQRLSVGDRCAHWATDCRLRRRWRDRRDARAPPPDSARRLPIDVGTDRRRRRGRHRVGHLRPSPLSARRAGRRAWLRRTHR